MGRPLKIRKTQGSTPVDSGFNNPDGLSNTYGVVGGNTNQSGAGTGPQILCRVKIGTQAEANGYIIRQKGAKKFLVGSSVTIQDENIVAGLSYVITLVGTTDWAALGASTNATVGDIFTAKISGSGLTTTGQVNRVGVCVLADLDDAALTDNTMTITATKADTSTFRLSQATNHWGLDFTTPDPYVLSFNAAENANPPDLLYPVVTVASA